MYVFDITKEQMWLNIDKELTDEEEKKIKDYYHQYVVEKRPLEYILWHVDFFGVPFFVNENTLIPRPETEYMINAVDEYIEEKKENELLLIDLWTWCWVLWISVILHNKDKRKKVYFTDISKEALQVAEKNYEDKIKDKEYFPEFIQSDMLHFISDKKLVLEWKIMIIVANLPYIPEETFNDNVGENVKNREPKMAFVWWDDGLMYYRILFNQYEEYKKSKSIKVGEISMFLEMMTRQVEILRKEYENQFVFTEVKTFHFNIRIVQVQEK